MKKDEDEHHSCFLPRRPQSFWPQAATTATTIVMITVPGRRAMIIMIVTAGITGGQGRFPSRARIT